MAMFVSCNSSIEFAELVSMFVSNDFLSTAFLDFANLVSVTIS